jgi:hypothetical protein
MRDADEMFVVARAVDGRGKKDRKLCSVLVLDGKEGIWKRVRC